MNWPEWEEDLLKTPALDDLLRHERWRARLRATGWWILTACACAAAVWLLVWVVGE